ncbi:MAG: leucine-rich repeat protein [Sodaliphilus sp.]
MQKFATLLALITFAAINSQAINVTNSAGQLSTRLSDTQVESLTISGTMDARDFKFIADNLNMLSSIDLSSASIVAYEAQEPVFAQQTVYLDGEIPQTTFFGKKLSQVQLPTNAKIIGYAAFAGCEKLTAISFPTSIDSIGSYAFSATGLTTITLPASVTKWGEGVFSRCKNLTSAEVESASFGKKTFFANPMLASVSFGSGVTAIGEAAFAGCTALTTLQWSSATQLANIGNEAFIATQITDANLTKFPKLASLGDWTYAGTPIAEVALPASVSMVGEGAFYYAKKLTNLVLPSKVTKVSAYLAAGTNVANSNIWGNDIIGIDEYALYNLSGISSLTIPAKVTKIGTKAMAGNTGLRTINAKPADAPILGMQVWAGINQEGVTLFTLSPEYVETPQWRDFNVMKKYYLGDANIDEVVNVTDITTITNHILGKDPSPFNFDAADCATDSVINVSDITAIIGLILRGETHEIYDVWEPNTGDQIQIPAFSIAPGETRTVEVNLLNENAYTALQFDIRLPEGLELVGINKANRLASHAIQSATLPNGDIRVIGYHAQNTDLNGSEGAILSLQVRASEALSADAAIEVMHTVLATADSKSYFAPATTTPVSNISGVTDVNAKSCRIYAKARTVVIESDVSGVAQFVDISGRSISLAVEAGHNEYDMPDAGIYIVKMGCTSQKLILK